MYGLDSSAELWKEGGEYYTETPEELLKNPVLPDLTRLPDRRLLELFERYGNLTGESLVLEVGCGRSAWLPYLALQKRCVVMGIDIEPFAAKLAEANLIGAGAGGRILCCDAFDPDGNDAPLSCFDLLFSRGVIEHFPDPVRRLRMLARYLKPRGRVLTTVPNLQGINWILQRFGNLERLKMHLIYDVERLIKVHEMAGYATLAAGYVGFYDGYLTAARPREAKLRRRLHWWVCWASSMCCAAWVRTLGKVATPELPYLAPHVFYVGKRGEGGLL